MLLLWGCHREEDATLVRLIETDPSRALDHELIFQTDVVHDWELPGATKSEGPDPNLPLLDRQVDFGAARVQEIEAIVESMPQGTLALRWQTSEHPFSKERQIQLQAEHQNPGPQKLFRFDVASHPLWAGQISGLRLYTDRRIRDSVAPIRARVLSRRVDPEGLEKARTQGWKVNLNREIRNALLAPPGKEIVRNLSVPPGAKLYLGYGLQGGIRQTVEFQVIVRFDNRPERTLFSGLIDGALIPMAGWHDAVIDLGDLVGRTVEIVLLTKTESPLDLATGLPLWANPEIVGRDHRRTLPNVLLISIDTLRADHLSLYGYERLTSPHLDRWAKTQAVVFENAVSQAPSTLPSHISLLTGLNAFRHGVSHDPAPASLETLAEILQRSGYRTLAQTGGGYMHPAYGFAQGFDIYRYWLWGYERLQEFPNGIEAARGWIQSYRDRPFFLFFHTYEVHAPYRARQPFYDLLTGGRKAPADLLWMTTQPAGAEEGFQPRRGTDYRYGSADPSVTTSRTGSTAEAIDLYDSSIAFVDEGLAELWKLLEALDLDDDTLVVLTSDHGEAFGEHDLAGHGYLYDDNLLVPLVISFPGDRYAGHRVERQVRSIDVLPTILDAIGLTPPVDIDGRSLIPLLEQTAESFPTEAWSYAANDNFGTALRINNRDKFIYNDAVWAPIRGQEELYRLDQDPGEVNDLSATAQGVDRLREVVQSTLARQSRGLLIRLANNEITPLTGELGGDWVGQTRIKAPHLPCACLWWSDNDTVRFEVPPRSRYDLILDANPATTGWIRLRTDSGSSDPGWEVERQLTLDELDEPIAFELLNGGWHSSASTNSELGTGVQIRWQRRNPDDGVDLSSAEADLRRQMKALGYVQ